MSTTTTPTIGIDHKYDGAVEALRDVHDEASLWHLSDELVKVAPNGVKAVEEVVAQAQARGIPTKSVATLRLYRDVAHRFPASERVSGVSFSAHREAITLPTVAEAKQLLTDLSVKHGAGGVTVTTVKAAIGAATGKVKATPTAKPKSSPYQDIAPDLSAGGKAFVAALDDMLTIKGVTLDGVHAGVTAILAAVEVRRSKAARKAAAKASKPTPASARPVKARPAGVKASPAKARPAATPAAGSKAGDLRDL